MSLGLVADPAVDCASRHLGNLLEQVHVTDHLPNGSSPTIPRYTWKMGVVSADDCGTRTSSVTALFRSPPDEMTDPCDLLVLEADLLEADFWRQTSSVSCRRHDRYLTRSWRCSLLRHSVSPPSDHCARLVWEGGYLTRSWRCLLLRHSVRAANHL